MEINYNNKIKTADLIICQNNGHVIIGNNIQNISPINMKVLMLLVKNQGRVVSRNQIFDSVWKNQEVSDDTLTRCISDLRAQIGKQHIKTFPKRGYQWMPFVEEVNDKSNNTKSKLNIFKIIKSLLLIVLGVFLLSLISLWIANKVIKPNQVRIAVLPFSVNLTGESELAKRVEGVLKSIIVESEKLNLISSNVTSNNFKQPYPSLNSKFGTQWIIEGQITHYQNQTNVSLSLVDAKTALVIYSKSSKTSLKDSEIFDFCYQFLGQISLD